MFGIDWEAAGYRFCDFVTWTAPRILSEQANHWRWEWKAAFGTLYPPGVFILAFYLAAGMGLLAAMIAVRRLMQVLSNSEDPSGTSPSPSELSIR